MSPPDTSHDAPPLVHHNAAANRFETVVDGHLAVAEYEFAGDGLVFTHTFVPPELRGRGIAGQLVRAALTWAREQKRTVVPACSYVAAFVRQHPEFLDIIDQSTAG